MTAVADRGAPRRESSLEPQSVGKHKGHFNGFDHKIIAIHVRCSTTLATCWTSGSSRAKPTNVPPAHLSRCHSGLIRLA